MTGHTLSVDTLTDSYVVRPSGPLQGTVRVGGAKNSVLKLMVAATLAEGRTQLTNVPRIADVDIMVDVLGGLGVSTEIKSDADGTGRLVLDSPQTLVPEAPYDLVEKIRASVVVLGPMLARCGRARVSLPGGDDFGSRPIDMHLAGLTALGAEFKTTQGYVEGFVPEGRLRGANVTLEYPSHTTTDNLLMAAVLARGTTVIENAAREPEVKDLAELLVAMGAQISGAGTSRIEIVGVDELHPVIHRVIPDRVVAATYMAGVGLAGGDVVIEGGVLAHMEILVDKLRSMGLKIDPVHEGRSLRVQAEGRLCSVDVATLPYPGVATDYKPFVVTLLALADGVGIVSENLFSGRFRYVDELCRMGADIRTQGHHAVVRGVVRLSGAQVRATDLRAGAALVLAGLVAEGETVVSGASHIERGYEDLPGKLAALGADIRRGADVISGPSGQ